MRSGLRITAATTTGPAQGPRPASSMPTTGPEYSSISAASRSKQGEGWTGKAWGANPMTQGLSRKPCGLCNSGPGTDLDFVENEASFASDVLYAASDHSPHRGSGSALGDHRL